MPSLQICHPDKPPTTLSLSPGRHRIGAAPDALIRLEGLPETAVELAVGETGRITLQARLPLQIAGQPFVAGVPRHLRPGEEIRIANVVVLLQQDLKTTKGTAALAKNILGNLVEGDISNTLPGLVWLTGPDLGKRVDLTEDVAFLGRGNGCELRVRDRLVSRQHAKMVMMDDSARIVDLKSPNGIWVNGQRVRGERALIGGDLIQVGCTLLAYESGSVPPPEPPKKAEPDPAAVPPNAPAAASPAAKDAAVEVPDDAAESVETLDEGAPEPKPRIRSEWLLAIAGLIALGIAAAVVAIVLT